VTQIENINMVVAKHPLKLVILIDSGIFRLFQAISSVIGYCIVLVFVKITIALKIYRRDQDKRKRNDIFLEDANIITFRSTDARYTKSNS